MGSAPRATTTACGLLASARENNSHEKATITKDHVGFQDFGDRHAKAVVDLVGEEPADDIF